MKFNSLSINNIILLEEMLKNQRLLKLIEYNNKNPYSQPDIENTARLINNKIKPKPFTEVPTDYQVEVTAFFPDGDLDHRVVLNSVVIFQVVVPDIYWLIEEESEHDTETICRKIRPYEIMSEIMEVFNEKSIKSVGKLKFSHYGYEPINKDYGMYSLEARIMSLS